MVSGDDGEELAELAGLGGDDPVTIRDLLPHALIECGAPSADLSRVLPGGGDGYVGWLCLCVAWHSRDVLAARSNQSG